jgi:peptidoglycan hydrolase-like protein with peptidoglycan-binding domain
MPVFFIFAMKSALRTFVICGCALLVAAQCSHAQSSNTTAHHTTSTRKKATRKKSQKTARRHGQQKIDGERAQQIQEALIREHYMTGKPSGTWDAATQSAMQKFQADNGWQSKTTPDSRALIKLGLGPDHEHLLNPESAMTSTPQPHTVSPSTTSNSSAEPSTPTRPE